MSLCGLGGGGKSGFWTGGEKIISISSHTHLCFCVSLNTGVVIIFDVRPATPPSPTPCGLVYFCKGLKGKLMLFTDACFLLFCFLIAGIY